MLTGDELGSRPRTAPQRSRRCSKEAWHPPYVIQARAILGRALREAEVAGLVTRNVARLTRRPRAARQEMRTLDATQARALIEAAPSERLGALFALALATGGREGELLALRWSDVDFDRGIVRVQRTLQRTTGGLSFAEPKMASSRRALPIGPVMLETLRRHRAAHAEERLRAGSAWQDEDLVFATGLGTPLDAGNMLRRSYYPFLARLGLPRLRFHDLRHSHATLLLEAGAHPRVVAERLGHSSPALTLNVYAHATPAMRSEAVAALDSALGAAR